jgi:hypothetical protein
MSLAMTALGEEFVDASGDPDSLPDFPSTFEMPTPPALIVAPAVFTRIAY